MIWSFFLHLGRITWQSSGVRGCLDLFATASGLVANLDKCVATPIHCSDQDLAAIQQIMMCRIGEFPSKYLGVPLSVYKLRRSDEQFLVDAVARRIPKWKGNMLNLAGRTTLVRSTLSAIPVHLSIVVCLSAWTIEAIDKRQRAFIWCGADSVRGGQCRLAWEVVCRPKELGGLGVLDLRRAGVAFRVRWEWLRRTDPRRTWCDLPCKPERAVQAVFQAATESIVRDGTLTFFWTDRWLQGRSIQQIAPALFGIVNKRRHGRSVASALSGRAWVWESTAPSQLRCSSITFRFGN